MAVPKRFGVLRLIGTLLKVLAWIVLAIVVLTAILAGVAGTQGSNLNNIALPPEYQPLLDVMANGGGIFIAIGILLVGLIYFLAIYALGENVHLRVATEENTRLTAALLLRMHQESQIEPEPAYPASGFATEPFQGR